MGLQLRSAMAQNLEPAQGSGDDKWSELARSHWLKDSKVKRVKPDVVKEIWDLLTEDAFDTRSLLTLESLQILER